MDIIRVLTDPCLVARVQRFCGVEYEKPDTCDQHTQTRRESSDSNEEEKKSYSSAGMVENGIQGSLKDPDISFGTVTHLQRATRNGNDNTAHSRHIKIADRRAQGQDNNMNQNKSSDMTLAKETPVLFSRISNPTRDYIVPRSADACSDKASRHFSECRTSGDTCPTDSGDGIVPADDFDQVTCAVKTPAVRIKYRSLLYLARFGAFLGNELFYLTFFPFLIWNVDSLIVRQVTMLWCVVMYLGQASKDYLRWPRPPCPPVVRLEANYSSEYSMPSTHAMSGTAIPLYLAYLAIERYEVPVFVAGFLALLWFSVTCWSRLYLGVHSVLDLLVGCASSLVIFVVFLGYVEGYDLYQQTHPFGGPVLLFTGLTMCTVLYPTHHKNSSKVDAVQIVAAYTGYAIGNWLGYQLGIMHESDMSKPFCIATPTLSWCFASFLRFISGVAVIGFLHTTTRWWSIRFYSYIYGLDEPDKSHPGVMIAYKFTTYAIVGSGAALFAPLLHLLLGIHRPALFYEVL